MTVVSSDNLDSLLTVYLQQTSSKHFEDPIIPRFLIQDRNDKFVFGIGGYVGAKAYYDYGGKQGGTFTLVNSEETKHKNDVGGVDLSSTRLFFKILGKTKRNFVDAYIEANFEGENYALKLQKAYIDLFGIRVGMSQTAFSDDESIDLIGAGMHYSYNRRSVPGISYSYRFQNGLRLQAGFESPQATSIYSKIDGSFDWTVKKVLMPHFDITANAYYNHNRLHLYAGTYFRLMQYYDVLVSDRFRNKQCYAVQAGGNYAFIKNNTNVQKIYLQGIYSFGLADCINNLDGKGLSAIMPNRLGVVSYDICSVYGASAGYTAAWGNNSINILGAFNKVTGHENSNLPQLYDMGLACAGNYMRTILKYGTIGAEFEWGRSYTLGNTSLSNFRVMILLRYNF